MVEFLAIALMAGWLAYVLSRPPKFCPQCGSKTVRVEYQNGYSSRTGLPIKRYKLRCSNDSFHRL